MSAVGYYYFHGQGVKQSYEKALEWYLKAAPYDDYAKCSAGSMYEKGLGTQVDMGEAIRLFTNAAEGGNLCGELWVKQHRLPYGNVSGKRRY
jgi:TPR repeat protein